MPQFTSSAQQFSSRSGIELPTSLGFAINAVCSGKNESASEAVHAGFVSGDASLEVFKYRHLGIQASVRFQVEHRDAQGRIKWATDPDQ
jgi:hypothetical protein